VCNELIIFISEAFYQDLEGQFNDEGKASAIDIDLVRYESL
jgi:hypothetical protein